MTEKHYITTPIYYVNDEPHIGHAYTTILADVITRYHALKGTDTYFLTGTDEHGQKVQQAAEKRDVTPLVHCDEYMQRFKDLWGTLHISNDDFIRTTEERHTVIVKKLLQDLFDKGDIYKDEYDGLYSVSEERFITQKEYDEGNFREVKKISESNYFFRMSKYQQQLIDHINSYPEFIQPENRKNEILGFLKNELGDLCISRPKSRLSWGVELPFDSDYVTYVWFDALTNYISAIGYGSDDKKFSHYWPAVHLIGKDILTTHSVYWPTMLMAAGIELPKTIFAHGWWMSEGTKMSKSLGNFIDLKTIQGHIDAVGVDVFRYFLVKEGPLFGDSDFSKTRFYQTYNTDLANDFGNLINRLFTLIKKNYDGKIPEPGEFGSEELALQKNADSLIAKVFDLLSKFELNQLVFEIFSYIRSINKYMENTAPWKLVKTDTVKAGTILYSGLASLRVAAALLSPMLTEKVDTFLDLLNNGDESGKILRWNDLKAGVEPGNVSALFPRFDLKTLEKASKTQVATLNISNPISFEDFSKIEMKTATIISAESVDGSDKLLKLQVDLGKEKRQIVAGIAKFFTAESLIEKSVIIVTNLEPAKIFGIESQGMLLTAQKGKRLTLLSPEDAIPTGAKIK